MRWLALLVATVATVHVTAGGRIGQLQVDRSTRADVIHAMGMPPAEARVFGYFEHRDPLDALGYHCARSYGRGAVTVGTTRCLDVFWIDARSGKLGNAVLMDRRFEGPSGLRVGTSSATAERVLHRRLVAGCTDAIHDGALTFIFAGGRVVATTYGNHIVGAHVTELVVDGHQDTGLFECL